MISQDMSARAYVAVTQTVSSRPSAGTKVTNANLPAGTVALVDEANLVLASMPTSGFVKFAYGVGSNKPLIFTAPFNAATVVSTKQKYMAASEQVTIIGYQGSGTANLPVVNSGDFGIYVRQEQEDDMFGGNCSHWLPMSGQFSTSTSSSASEFAMYAADAIFASVNEWKQEITNLKPSYLRVQVITNGVATAIAQTASPVNGFSEVTFSAAPAGVAIGDYILLDSDTYIVENIVGAVVTLTTKYRGATATGVACSEVASPTLFGLKFTGLANEFDRIMYPKYTKNSFDVFIQREGSPVVLTKSTTPAKEGIGVWEKVTLDEYSSLLSDNQGTLVNFIPNQEPPKFAVEGKKYSIVNVQWTTQLDGAVVGYTGKTYGNVSFMLELGPVDTLVAGSQGDQLAETILGANYTTGDLNA
jgi:hypothetical protein